MFFNCMRVCILTRYLLRLHHVDVFHVSGVHSTRPQLSPQIPGDARNARMGKYTLTSPTENWRVQYDAAALTPTVKFRQNYSYRWRFDKRRAQSDAVTRYSV